MESPGWLGFGVGMRPALTIATIVGSRADCGTMLPAYAVRVTGSQAENEGEVDATALAQAAAPVRPVVGRFSAKLPCCIRALGTVVTKLLSEMNRKPAYDPKKNSLSRRIGPPTVKPKRCWLY